jgi:hypothetical protein
MTEAIFVLLKYPQGLPRRGGSRRGVGEEWEGERGGEEQRSGREVGR